MREIKFRAWDKEKKKIVPIVDINWAFNGTTSFVTVWGVEKEEEGGYTIDFENCIIMQYTGLKDKNGLTDVYECDIIDDEGNVKGNIYEMDKGKTDFVIQGFGTKDWCATYYAAVHRGCKDAE